MMQWHYGGESEVYWLLFDSSEGGKAYSRQYLKYLQHRNSYDFEKSVTAREHVHGCGVYC